MSPRRDEKRISLGRYVPLLLCLAATAAALLFAPGRPWLWAASAVAGALALLGLYDLAQPSHSVRRNYPIVGNLRWLFESIRPEIRQYLLEGDNEEAPFSRSQRSLVYARSKNEGSERDFYCQSWELGRPDSFDLPADQIYRGFAA